MDFRLLLLLEERTINCSLQLPCTLWIIKPCMHACIPSIMAMGTAVPHVNYDICHTPLDLEHRHHIVLLLRWRHSHVILMGFDDECAPCLVSLNLGLYYHNSAQFTKKINKYFKKSFDKKKMENANRKKLLELDKKNILKG